MTDLLTCLHDELGAERVLPQSGWSTRTRPGTFRPGVVMNHWTAAFSSVRNPAPSTSICMHGLNRPDLGYYLSGPLYHLLVGHDGKVRLIHRGIGNHAGRGSLAALNLAMQGRVPHDYRPGADTAVLSSRSWAVSLDYHPDMGPPPDRMIDGAIGANVALHRFQGWDDVDGDAIVRAFDHRHATRRKRDNDVIADFRPQVAARLVSSTPAPVQEDDHMIPYDTDHPDARSVRKLVNHLFTVTGDGSPPHTGWLPDTDRIDLAAAAAIIEALQRLADPGWWGSSAAPVDLINEGVDVAWIQANGVGLAITTALGAGIAIGVTRRTGRAA